MTSAAMLDLLDDHISPHPARTEADRLLLGVLHELVEELERLQSNVSTLLEVVATERQL